MFRFRSVVARTIALNLLAIGATSLLMPLALYWMLDHAAVDLQDTALREQAAEIAEELQEKQLAAKTVQVTVRYGDFTKRTRQVTMEDPVAEAGAIYRLGCHLLARHKLVNRPLRLIGLGVSSLTAPRRQLQLPLGGT